MPTQQGSIRSVHILGTRGVPAAHGGFETLADRLSRYLVGQGFDVTVYCQVDASSNTSATVGATSMWEGVRRVEIPVKQKGPFGTVIYDLISVRHAMREAETCLVLGYNTSVFTGLLRLKRVRVLTNMDGVEWIRPKWSRPVRCWFYLNAWFAVLFSNALIADHPEIARLYGRYRPKRRISTIAYGGG